MVRVSKRRISDKLILRIYQLFFEVVAKSRSRDTFLILIGDILSPKEKIMIGKRIGIIYLLAKGFDQSVIADILKVSGGTVSRYNLLFHGRETELIKTIKFIIAKEKVKGFLDDVFMELFNQPGIKIGHWQSYWEHKRRQEIRRTI